MTVRHLQLENKIIAEITKSAVKQLNKTEKSNVEKFTAAFYKFASTEDLVRFDKKSMAVVAKETYKFLKKRQKNKPKIRIFNPSVKTDGWESEYTIVEIINDDKPFLIDSVTEEINRHEYKIHQLLFPVINVERNKKQELVTIKTENKSKSDINDESVMHFKISHISDTKEMKTLEKDILNVLSAVSIAVKDWRGILKRVEYILAELTISVESLYQAHTKQQPELRDNIAEIKYFIEWLKNNNFVFLGYSEYVFEKQVRKTEAKPIKKSELGLYKQGYYEKHTHTFSNEQGALSIFDKEFSLLEITKSNKKSPVHRPVQMDYIRIKRFNKDGEIIGEHRLLGLFTSIVYYQSARQIPIIRKKISSIQKLSGFSKSSHNGKALTAILEDFPRDELFQSNEELLLDISMDLVMLAMSPRVRLFLRKDTMERFISCIIFIPRERMSTELRQKMEIILRNELGGEVVNHYTQVTEAHLARLQIIIQTQPGDIPEYNITKIEEKLANAARLWMDGVREELLKHYSEKKSDKLLAEYNGAFSISYQNRFTAEDAYYDIIQINKLIDQQKIIFDLYKTKNEEKNIFHLKIYNYKEKIALSKMMPVLDNMGIEIIDEHTYLIKPSSSKEDIWIHFFRFEVCAEKTPRLNEIKENFETTLQKIWFDEVQNSGFSKLIISALLNYREIMLLMAYSKYLQQIRFPYSQSFIEDALSSHPGLIKQIVDLFFLKFDPAIKKERDSQIEEINNEIEKKLSHVVSLAEDKVIRSFKEAINATVRTNFFQINEDKEYKTHISLKIDSSKVPDLPLPRPFREIFVYSPRVEGIHLRGGKVARGGLRWSDRTEDFRTEVLGLMKAQMTKNSIIVPVGSKGGFVLKKAPVEGGREALVKEAIECYKTFLRGMLDITDNVINGKIIKPQNVICFDEDDPYLVVAADKGTATFSDIANSISKEFNFWLGDAFASGGSEGYDHKKMGITARGAWVSVKRHFSEMGVDIDKEEFTVAGIGDMAGDVFGNGMLLSKHIKLVAAFNHMHIFIDPNPDSAKSFKERKRLFNLSRSTWKDYDPKMISKGGGIYERSSKIIKISKEAKDALSTNKTEFTPDELVKAILLSSTDLLWNGGIGSYVKSKNESNDDVGDKANDNVRVNGNELRVKVVGEGGNLGFTQLGRIEFAQSGGRINTDSIDNSAGVDCSDHEVNIKIALAAALEKKKISMAIRNKVLEKMTNEVAALVLKDNVLQTLSLTISQIQGHSQLEVQAKFIEMLEKNKLLNREIEFLPDEEQINRLHTDEKGLTRPENSVLLAYSKLVFYDELLNRNLPDDPYYEHDLINYFPKTMQKEFKNEIINHPLRREIIATVLSNEIVNRMGTTYFYRLLEDTGQRKSDIARAFTVVRDIFELNQIWDDIEKIENSVTVQTKVELYTEVQNLTERTSLWFLHNYNPPMNVSSVVAEFKKGVKDLTQCLNTILSPFAKQVYQEKLKKYKQKNVPDELAKKIAGMETLGSACDIVSITNKTILPVRVIGKIYFELGARLQFGWMRNVLYKQAKGEYWDRLSIKTIIDELYDQQVRLTTNVVNALCDNKECSDATDKWVKNNQIEIRRYDKFIDELKSSENINFSMLVVASRRIKELLKFND